MLISCSTEEKQQGRAQTFCHFSTSLLFAIAPEKEKRKLHFIKRQTTAVYARLVRDK